MGCVTSLLSRRKRHAYIGDIDGKGLTESELLESDNFEFGDLIQTGGVGRVYAGIRKTDRRPVALKAFGYTNRIPSEKEVHREIKYMKALIGVSGIVQMLGVFLDTSQGLVSGKLCTHQFPVIVMELIDGGDFLQRVFENRMVSEKILSQLFKGLIKTLKNIHEKGFLHRDIKLENLLYCKYETFSMIKLIDFGMMVQLPAHKDVYISDNIQGTPGYLAPESISSFEYSPATDLWQAGCCLYTMLSAEPAFPDNDLQQITDGHFNEMKGFSWVGVSDEAKDLVASMLNKDKKARIKVNEILQHPWILNAAPDVNMEKEYYARIKTLVFRRNLRKVFKECNIHQENMKHRELLQTELPNICRPFKRRKSAASVVEVSPKIPSPPIIPNVSSSPKRGLQFGSGVVPLGSKAPSLKTAGRSGSSGNLDEFIVDIAFQKRIGKLKSLVLSHLCPDLCVDEVFALSSNCKIGKAGFNFLSYDKYLELLCYAELPELASLTIFQIFDTKKRGNVSVSEFLTSLIAFRPISVSAAPSPVHSKKQVGLAIDGDIISSARLYFELFDVKDTGSILLEEMKFIIICLLTDDKLNITAEELHASEKQIEDIFLTINLSKNGQVDFEEFLKFYNSVMMTTSKLRFSRASLQEVLRNRKSIITE